MVDTKFVRRVLDPKIAEGVKKSETKRDMLMLSALTSSRGTAVALAELVLDDVVLEADAGAPVRVISPEIHTMIDRIAAQELFDPQQQFIYCCCATCPTSAI